MVYLTLHHLLNKRQFLPTRVFSCNVHVHVCSLDHHNYYLPVSRLLWTFQISQCSQLQGNNAVKTLSTNKLLLSKLSCPVCPIHVIFWCTRKMCVLCHRLIRRMWMDWRMGTQCALLQQQYVFGYIYLCTSVSNWIAGCVRTVATNFCWKDNLLYNICWHLNFNIPFHFPFFPTANVHCSGTSRSKYRWCWFGQWWGRWPGVFTRWRYNQCQQ